MKRLKKSFFIVLTIFVLLFVLLFFASTLIKNYVVKHSQELVGRKIGLANLKINYLDVSVTVDNFVLYEANKTDSFVSFQKLYINFDPTSLLKNEYAFAEISLINPRVSVEKKDSIFNFDDIIAFFADTAKVVKAKQADTTKQKEMQFSIKNFLLKGGKVHYLDKILNKVTDLNDLKIELPYIAWNSRKAEMGISFKLGEAGKIELNSILEPSIKKFEFFVKTTDISLEPFTIYTKDYMNMRSMKGFLNSDLKLKGNYDLTEMVLSGDMAVNNLSMTDLTGTKLASVDKVYTKFEALDLMKSSYHIAKVEVFNPAIIAIMDKKGTNIERMFAPFLKVDTSVKKATASADTAKLYYRVDSVLIHKGLVNFEDKTLNRSFFYKIADLEFAMGKLTESTVEIPMSFSALLNNKGMLSGNVIYNMLEMMNLSMKCSLKKLELSSFSPYTEYYIARPITQGRFNYDMSLKMTPKSLENQNKILVENIKFGKKTKDTTAMKVPVQLGLALLKDSKGNIEIDLPISGSPSDPTFRYGKLIWQTFLNLMVKAASQPFKAFGALLGSNPESIKKVQFEYLQDSLSISQKEKLDKIADMLKMKPELFFILSQETNPDQEKKLLAIYDAKRLCLEKKFGVVDQLKLSKMDEKDTLFISFVKGMYPATDASNIGESCLKIAGASKIELEFNNLLTKRNGLVVEYLKTKNVVPTTFEVSTADLKNLSEEQKSPSFRVEVTVK